MTEWNDLLGRHSCCCQFLRFWRGRRYNSQLLLLLIGLLLFDQICFLDLAHLLHILNLLSVQIPLTIKHNTLQISCIDVSCSISAQNYTFFWLNYRLQRIKTLCSLVNTNIYIWTPLSKMWFPLFNNSFRYHNQCIPY